MDERLSIRLTREPLDAAAAITTVNAAGVGGVDIFLGVTRPEQSPALGELTFLEYHCYEEMATAELQRLLVAADARWKILRGLVWHRLGRVAVGEASVIVAVGCAHRGDAFDACRFLIDELKKTVPIWKKEIFSGDARWQTPGE